MALTSGADYRTAAQQVLQDTAGVRFTSAMVFNGIEQGLADMARVRPDVFFSTTPVTTVVDATSLAFVDEAFRPALLDYTLYYCETTDQESGDISRAMAHRQSYVARMTGAAS